MKTFEEFLKKKQLAITHWSGEVSSMEYSKSGHFIDKYDLGEWAWETSLGMLNDHGDIERYNDIYREGKGYKDFYDFMFNHWDNPIYYLEMAEACLGKGEIRKRINQLTKFHDESDNDLDKIVEQDGKERDGDG